jgi:RNA polymerase subunit RPABC4/transcription elongation factor Spt4
MVDTNEVLCEACSTVYHRSIGACPTCHRNEPMEIGIRAAIQTCGNCQTRYLHVRQCPRCHRSQ